MMASRRIPVKTFVPPQKENVSHLSDEQSTFRKSVWSPQPSLQSLVDKVDLVEQRLDTLEDLIGRQTDPEIKRKEQEEVEQSRHELEDMRRQLNDAVKRLQRREADLHATKNALDNLSNQADVDRQKISALEVEKKELQQLVQELERKLNERIKKVDRLEKQMAEMQRSLNNTNNQLAWLQQKMEQMELQMSTFKQPDTSRPSDQQHGSTVTEGLAELPSTVTQTPSRHCTGALGLPPIPLPPQYNKNTRSSAMNFPPYAKAKK